MDGNDPRDPAVWGGHRVEPGERRDVTLNVGESYSGMTATLPMHVWRGEKPGPTLFVTGAVHGDEINGTGAVRSILLTHPFELRAGTLLLVPVVNMMGFERHSRYLPDRRDLNRSFPGSKRGSLASRLARSVFQGVVARSDYGIDLHTAAVRRTNFPNLRADMTNEKLAHLARAFGAELILNNKGPTGSLRREATESGCPTMILEAGEVWKVEPTVVEYMVRGVRNCLISLGMVEGEPSAPASQTVVEVTRWIRAEAGGFLRFHMAPGEVVEEGDAIATHTSIIGEELGILRAPRSGVVLGMTTLPAVAPGDPVCHLAYPKRGALRRFERAIEGLPEGSLHERVRDDLSRSITVAEASSDSA